jgi:protocatechuate 3,4-dioxygenase beta subunit
VIPSTVLGLRPSALSLIGGGCDPTTDDIQGPFYLPGAPTTTMIADINAPGTRLYISGTILSSDCQTPLPNVMIEVWQANDAAEYDTSANFELRGTMFSDSNGFYAYETIKPGPYLNGNQFRPSHIHYKVSGPGFPNLVTQLYFEGDQYIPNDPWASDPDAVLRIIPLNSVNGNELEGVFDIVMDGMLGIKPNRFGEDGDLLPPFPNPSSDLTSIHFNIFRSAEVKIVITDMSGKELVTLIDEQSPQGRFTTQWNGRNANGQGVSAGMYLATLIIDGKIIKSQRIIRN